MFRMVITDKGGQLDAREFASRAEAIRTMDLEYGIPVRAWSPLEYPLDSVTDYGVTYTLTEAVESQPETAEEEGKAVYRMTCTSKAGQRESLDFDTREAAIRHARQEYGIPVAYWTLNGGYTVEVSYYGEVVSIRETVEEPEAPAAPLVCVSATGRGKVHLVATGAHVAEQESGSLVPACGLGYRRTRWTGTLMFVSASEGSEVTCSKCKSK